MVPFDHQGQHVLDSDYSLYKRLRRNGLLADQIREPTTRTGTADSPMESDVPFKMVVKAVTVR